MLDWLACFAFNWFQRDPCLQLNIRCKRNSANTLSVEFEAKSFFPISPEIKKDGFTETSVLWQPHRCSLPTVRFNGAAMESTTVRQTLTKTKRLDTRPKYPERCKEKYQKNLFRLSFQPHTMTHQWLYTLKNSPMTLHTEGSDFQLREMFFLEDRAHNAPRVNMGL